MEYLDQYNFNLEYHPGKANVVADALSRKTQCSAMCLAKDEWDAMRILNEFGLQYINELGNGATLFTLEIRPILITRVIEAQREDE
ncbi:hypothetical protein, partial [Klebsiella pneumoniae]|uniref:hypothetical protein n=1 Tax=Klebsiella pneumoniae TaxID=573 RepID=UPI0022351A60